MFMVIALASGGVANAALMADCPMLQGAAEEVMAASHDCCPDDQAPAPSDQPAEHMGDCAMGQACRTTPAMTPTVVGVRVALSAINTREPLVSDTGVSSRAPDAFWRPPRTI